MKHKVYRKALITSITGQDGSYLAELLLSKGVKVNMPSVLCPMLYANIAESDYVILE